MIDPRSIEELQTSILITFIGQAAMIIYLGYEMMREIRKAKDEIIAFVYRHRDNSTYGFMTAPTAGEFPSVPKGPLNDNQPE